VTRAEKRQVAPFGKPKFKRKRTETARLAKNLKKYRFEFSKHLFDSEIPSTNNYAERTLRSAVVLRKVGCGATRLLVARFLASFDQNQADEEPHIVYHLLL
jgi:hypothetical protein